MAEEVQEYFKLILPTIEGLEAIVVTDKDGIPIAKASSGSVPQLALKPAFLSTFAMASEQANKLGLSQNKSIICMYSGHQLVQFNYHPVVVSLIAQESANTGSLLAVENEIQRALAELRNAVEFS
ncbi:ragulator complex protein LAMTOR3-like [Corticium candelabrum]|uniref:ragulator complex protein LAMTOR3-like n=1 Tax=Corticium candelabrum TaxID=121492 RepID=UPI002E257593|nr:ragulator complex protein LAMTOR3-like [Corticium candelabrum]